MSADRLREAARVLREQAANGDYSIDPDLGLALADWLDKAAQEWDVWGEHDRNIDKPLVLADLILGAES